MDALLSELPHAREHVHVLLELSSRQQDVQGQVGPCSPDPGTVEKKQEKKKKKEKKKLHCGEL